MEVTDSMVRHELVDSKSDTEVAHSHLNGDCLHVGTFLGQKRPRETETLENLDVVLTTYSTLTKDYQTHKMLQNLHWFRVILDEGI